MLAAQTEKPKRSAPAKPPPPDLPDRLRRVVSKILKHAARAGLRHFRYCALASRAAADRNAYERCLRALEAELSDSHSACVCEASVIEHLQQAALLSCAPPDLPAPLRAELSKIVVDALERLR